MHEKLKELTNIESKRKEYEKILKPKITVVVHGILGILDYYDKYDDDQQSFLETRIGAEFYYLPKRIIFNYSGKASKKALELRSEGKKATADHYNVRKICGKNAINTIKKEVKNGKNEKELVDIITKKFIDIYGQYNYTTSDENNSLKVYQTEANFSSSEKPYKKLGIKLFNDNKWIGLKLKMK